MADDKAAATEGDTTGEPPSAAPDAPPPVVKPVSAVTMPVKVAPGQATPPLTRPPVRPLRDADPVAPRVEVVSVGAQGPASPLSLPGASKDGYLRLPTGPTAVTAQNRTSSRMTLHPWSPVEEAPVEWQPAELPEVAAAPLAPWALAAAIISLVSSFFVGWGLPLAVLALIAGIMCVRRPSENRATGVWSVALSAVAVVFSAGWLVWAAWAVGWIG